MTIFLTHVYCRICRHNALLATTSRCFIDIATQQIDKNVAVARGNTNECLSSRVPIAAPKNISRTARRRRRHRGLVPPASFESAPRPVMVKVRTVVVRSGIAILRTVAFRIPIAHAVSTMIEYDWNKLPDESRKLIAARVATNNKADSMIRAVVIQFGLTSSERRVAARPPITAPMKNAPSAVSERGIESPGAPATANPRKTTFPVMFAVKTCPRLR